jgi:GLPGLI family protein
MGQKMALKATKEEIEKVLAKIPTATMVVGTETKQIAGYNCKKVDFTQEGKTTTIYTTEDLVIPNSNWQNEYKDVPNVILEFLQVIPTQDAEIKMLVAATEVKKEKVKAEMFLVPAGYQEMSMSEFKKMMGGAE